MVWTLRFPMLRCSLLRMVFFFQAEDGIRDLIVTGVQTCALPICPRPQPREPDTSAPRSVAYGPAGRRRASIWAKMAFRNCWGWGIFFSSSPLSRPADRSEERRVGKEGRSRWSPDHLKKKRNEALS